MKQYLIVGIAAAFVGAGALCPAEAASCNAQVDRADLGYSFVPQILGSSYTIRILTGVPYGNFMPHGLDMPAPASPNVPAMTLVMDYQYDPSSGTLTEEDLSFQFTNDLVYADGSIVATDDLITRLILPSDNVFAEGSFHDLGNELALFQGEKYPAGVNDMIIGGSYLTLMVIKDADRDVYLTVNSQFNPGPGVTRVAKEIISERAKEAAAGACSL